MPFSTPPRGVKAFYPRVNQTRVFWRSDTSGFQYVLLTYPMYTYILCVSNGSMGQKGKRREPHEVYLLQYSTQKLADLQ